MTAATPTTPAARRPDLAPLEALEARRDDLFDLLRRNGGSPADWREYERLTAALQAELLGDHLWPASTFDPQGCEQWEEQRNRRDPFCHDDPIPY